MSIHRKTVKIFCTAILCASCSGVWAETVVDTLMKRLIDKHIPAVLHEAVDQPWTDGTFTLRLFKAGSPDVKGDEKNLTLGLPIRAELSGHAKKDLGVAKIDIKCQAKFVTRAQVAVVPTFSLGKTTAKSEIDLPIPPVMAQCDGISIPVDAVLTSLVEASKLQWQADIDKAMNEQLQALMLQ